MPTITDLTRYPSSLLNLAICEMLIAMDLLANPVASANELGAAAKAFGNAYANMRTSRIALRGIRSHEALKILQKIHQKDSDLMGIQSEIIRRLNEMKAEPLGQRILCLLSERSSLSTSEIARAINQQNKDIENARAEWKLALGSPVVFVFPDFTSKEQISSALESLRRGGKVKRRYALLGAWQLANVIVRPSRIPT